MADWAKGPMTGVPSAPTVGDGTGGATPRTGSTGSLAPQKRGMPQGRGTEVAGWG